MTPWATSQRDVATLEEVQLISEDDALRVINGARAYQQSHSPACSDESTSTAQDAALTGWWDMQTWAKQRRPEGFTDTWTEVAKVVWSSLRASVQHVDALSFEAIAFGYVAVAKKHESQEDSLEGLDALREAGAQQPRAAGAWPQPETWPVLIEWCSALYLAPPTHKLLAEGLGIDPSCVLRYQPKSVPLCPAYFLAVDHARQTVLFVVRGTSQLHDLVADVCGHCVQFFTGHAHCGMVRVAMHILAMELDHMEAACRAFPGYQLHLLGHSLGGGVAALMCYILRNTPSTRARLLGGGASSIVATTFGCPPIMSEDLSMSCGGYIASVVYQNDMVARTCVHTIQALALEMQHSKDEVFAGSELLSLFKASGATDAATTAVSTIFKHYTVQRLSALSIVKSPLMQAALSAGVSWVTGLVAEPSTIANNGNLQQHQQQAGLFSVPPEACSSSSSTAPTTQFASLSSSLLSWGSRAVRAAAARSREGTASSPATVAHASSSLRQLSVAPGSFTSLTSAAQPDAGPAAASVVAGPSGSFQGSSSSSGSIKQGMGAMMLAAAVAAAAAPSGRGYEMAWSSLKQAASGSPAALPSLTSVSAAYATTTELNSLSAHPPAPPQLGGGAAGEGVGCRELPSDGLVPGEQCPLYTAGQLFHIERRGMDEKAFAFRIIRGHGRQRFCRLLIKNSMLKDHFLMNYQFAVNEAVRQARQV